MECRPDCGACCIAISISSPIPGMPEGKPAGVRCIHLHDDYRCALFADPSRPKVCGDYVAEELFCGKDREEAMKILYSFTELPFPASPNGEYSAGK
ncbi:MAG TPA: YkgJ family cysteine cluster protein [Bacteroidales bacterium]|nr:YkgJ family cysteine cluster protein [Bacteroidales bacterium]